ncbi:class I adenylate-forming enzyme family protein [Ramlibacter sp. PS3R-8]|uniref:class I adenylate-forming enzyme family protein n=1 Tax=Ramlibacter sp. PS3R-8 TaxID=3133437 RepID=UPI003097E80D
MRAPPLTAEWIENAALRAPRRPALRDNALALDYGQLHAMVTRCTGWLRDRGVQRGDRIAVGGPGFVTQMIVLLAAEAVGAVTASFVAEGDPDAPFLFTQVRHVIAETPQDVPSGVAFHALDDAWMQELGSAPVPGQVTWTPPPWDAPHRIVRTSGSAGASKFMVLTRGAFEYRLRMGPDAPTSPDTRLLMLAPLVVNACWTRSSTVLRQRGLVMVGGGADIVQLAPTEAWGLPMQLQRLLGELPAGYRAPRPVNVATAGALVSAADRTRIRSVFGGTITSRYGNNEAGSVCDDLDAAGRGLVSAGCDLRIVDEEGRELPQGAYGRIALRTPSMVTGYLDRPEETAAAFRDGWFVGGDVGAMLGSRLLQLAGRQDDLVNIGGLKFPASRFETVLREQPAIADAAAVAVHLEDGAITLGLAVVLSDGATRGQAEQQVIAALCVESDVVARLLVLTEMPRLGTGKVDRQELLRLFRQQA